MALSFISPGKLQFNGKLVACAGYGVGYGYTGGPPTVTSVSPIAGGIAGGTSVTITGQGFCNFVTAVTFGGTAATSFVDNSDTSITAVSPAHAAGTVDVRVTNTAGTSAISAADHFTYTTNSYYFMWYDKASPGMLNDNIHIVNTSGSTANIVVSVSGTSMALAPLASGAEVFPSFPQGTIGGPVVVNSDQAILVSQRVQYYQSFNEVWAETSGQAATTLYFQWYDRISSPGFTNDNIHVLNPGTTTATVNVTLGASTQVMTLAAGASSLTNFPGKIGGPVVVSSNVPVLASQRVQYFQSFNEVWAEPATMAATTSYFTWFDKASPGMLNDNIHVYNPGVTDATVIVALPSGVAQIATVAAGTEAFISLPLRFTWYDHISSPGFTNDNIHLFNPGGAPATVAVALPGFTTQNVTVAGFAEVLVKFPTGFGGPVTITSDVAILASQRVQFFQSFNEIWAT